ncbi:MAG: type II-B CRISPR-associated RNA-guided endonuclease Cas9/Csx12 [Sulfurimonas sp.]|uniref:type II-B CRISPR-associated RNA-guided endonuclease Cas9/Csx12 n=1 Tax=Sulfurimonas sp. TaxID=2022749 RepID=UPI0026048C13|nr:type II-B CRISPR-associated RNA-guided endonuclease Cas9/Csx12 [Sulfurimonas sp.]MDD2652861.1 type II-B CRISPR-associated RNA-guided endonuclease Cas9/Csx12 [Sulfurimonas sp.]MDD3450906.1 type II-B CRISPR-associated RNA-guided endonuclease Cas9/Csx12 [Sulfurimonas sp.]
MTSVLSLDLGGKNTGFFSFTSQDVSKIEDFQSGTIIYHESFVLSQVGRRGKRHTKRNNLRNKLVKRLFLLILQKHYGLDLQFLPDEILGLFNKRGYTYASFEIDDDKREKLESDELREVLEDRFGQITQDSIERFLTDFASNEDEFKKFFGEFKFFKEEKSKEKLSKELKSGLKIVEDILNDHDKQQNQGNLPRAKYFTELNLEIVQNEKIQEFFRTHNLQIQDIQNLIGNLSNYQLKELRRYFNDIAMKNSDIWKPEQLHKVTWRFIQSWHSKNDEDKVRQKENLKELKAKNIIEFLTSTNPIMTIPPYDDMNNRGAVKCQTLRLNEEYLNKYLPNWRNITEKLASENQKENLEDSTVRGYSTDSTLLHRILDTSSQIDEYELRAEKPSLLLQKTLGSDTEKFHSVAKEYYELIRSKVRTGIWTSSDDMLKKCDHNPPYKNNQIHNLVAGILGVKISSEQFEKFETELWNAKFGNKKLSSYCKNIEELRKSHGNLFKSYIEELFKEDKKEFTKDEQNDKKLLDLKVLNEWVEKIREIFGIEEKYRARFNNHFSMAQLHTIIDTKRSGFNSTCKWCSAENQYRASTNIEINQETGEVITNANCQRLPADTQRPFSGKIERYIDKLGYEIAKIKAKEIEAIDDKKIDLKIILEQNAFEYEESIRSAKIKNANAKAKKSLEDATVKYKKSLDDKSDRIKAFSSGICPYCGENLGDDGEIDHILPRSYTLKKYDTVFNSEGNLLFVHQKCNQAKLAKTNYTLQDLKIDISQKWIEEQIATIKNYKTFTILTQPQQKAFKYALFLNANNKAYQKVVGWLRTDQSSRVNGTQKYLAKKIQEKLKAMLPNKEFDFEFILADANDVHDLRNTYAKENPLLQKPDTQPPSSHTIDAIMAFLSVYPKVARKEELPNSQKVIQWIEINNIKTKSKGKIDKDKIANLGGTTIFKDSIYQERFAPIYEFEKKFYTGFVSAGTKPNFDNCNEIKQKDFESVKPYFKNKIQKPNGLNIYEIDKQKTLTLFHNISKGLSEELKFAELLNKFSYNLLKTSVSEAPKILKDDKKLSTKIYDKTVILPIKQEWVNFDKAFRKYLENKGIEYKEKDGKYNVGEDILSEFCKNYFNIQNKPIRNKARKVFSLPTVEAPSGGFRIKRKNHKGENIYQLVGIDGAKSAGFGIKDGKINTAVDVTLSTLVKSKSISFKDPQKMELQEHIDMANFRDITDSVNLDGIKIFVAPASTNRPLVRTVLAINKFMQIINNQDFNYLELSDLKFTTDESFGVIKEKFDELFEGCNFAPRDKFKIIKANTKGVEIEFSNNNKTIMKHYDSGVDIKLND